MLSRIDPATNKVSGTIPVAPGSFAAVFGFGSVWLTTTGAASVQRVDPATNRVVATIPVGPDPRFLAAGEGGVWTLNQKDGTVTRIDPVTDSVVATIDAGVPGSGGDIATGGGFVWVRAKKTLLLAIDPRTNRIARRYGPPAGSGAVRANATRVLGDRPRHPRGVGLGHQALSDWRSGDPAIQRSARARTECRRFGSFASVARYSTSPRLCGPELQEDVAEQLVRRGERSGCHGTLLGGILPPGSLAQLG